MALQQRKRTEEVDGTSSTRPHAEADAEVTELQREYRHDEYGTLEHLLDVCQEAALGARLAAEIFAHDADLVALFTDIAAERDSFCIQLALLLSRETHSDEIAHSGTFWGRLFHWRLQLAKRIQMGYREIDDRRINMHIIQREAEQVLDAYQQAEGRLLSPAARTEVHRQTERIRAANAQISEAAFPHRPGWNPRDIK